MKQFCAGYIGCPKETIARINQKLIQADLTVHWENLELRSRQQATSGISLIVCTPDSLGELSGYPESIPVLMENADTNSISRKNVYPFTGDRELITQIRLIHQQDAAHEKHRARLVDTETRLKYIQHMFEVSPEGVAITDNRGYFIAVNQLGAVIFGYQNPSDAIGKSILSVVHPDDHLLAYKIREIAERDGIAKDQTMRYLHPDQSIVSVVLTLSALKDTAGNILGFIGVTRGIEEWLDGSTNDRMQYPEIEVQSRLRSAELRQVYSTLQTESDIRRKAEAHRDFLLEIIENAPEIIAYANQNFELEYANQVGLAFWGARSLDELAGKNVFQLHDPEDIEFLTKVAVPTAEKEGIWIGESNLRGLDGAIIPVSHIITYHPHRDRSFRYVSIFRDIRSLKQKEDALRESQELYQTLAETAHDIITLTDLEQRIVYINQYGADLLDCSVDELVGKSRDEVMQLKESHQVDETPVDQQNVSGARYVEELFTISSGQIWLGSWVVPISKSDGSQLMLAISRDITYNKEIEHQLSIALSKEKELNDLKSRFVSMVSHEFRTPLSSLLSSVELLEAYGQSWDHGKRDKHIQRIKDAVNLMNILLEDILVIGRIDAGKYKPNPQVICPMEFCKQTIEAIIQNDQGRHKIHYNVSGTCSKAYLDPEFLRQIMSNLLSNAINFSLPGGNITVGLKCTEEAMQLEFIDEGIGISQQELERIFDPFMRGVNVGAIKGSGLGMTIVRNAVDLCGGEIKITSRINKGTKVTVTIPLIGEEKP